MKRKPYITGRGHHDAQSMPKSFRTYELSYEEKIKFMVLCGLALMAVSYLFYHSILLSLLSFGFVYPCLGPYRTYLAEKRRKELKEQFRDVLYSVSASVSAGRQLPEALHEAQENMKLIYKEDSMIVSELADMVKRLYEYRESEEEILKDFADRTQIEDIRDFVDIYLTCRETGGDLIKILTKASGVIMDKISIEKEIRAVTVQKKFEAKILTGIPFLVILFLQVVSPEYLAPMYEGLYGRVLMTAALCGIGFAYLWSIRLTKIDI